MGGFSSWVWRISAKFRSAFRRAALKKRVRRNILNTHIVWAPVAQLDRASASGVEGRAFESRRVYQFFILKHQVFMQLKPNSK